MRSLGRIAPLTVVDLLGIDGFGPGALEHLRVRAEIWLTRQVVGVEDSTTAGPTAPLRPETQGLAALAFDLEPGNESSDPNSGELGNAADESLSCDLFGPLCRALDSLNDRERLVIIQRYRLDGAGQRTLEEIGQALGVTRERARQIEQDALQRLRLTGHLQQVLRAFAPVESLAARLGLDVLDRRLDVPFARLHPEAGIPATALSRLAAAARDEGAHHRCELYGFDASVVALLSRRGPLPLDELAAAAVDALDPNQLERFPDFSAVERLQLLGPAVPNAQGRWQLPDEPIPGMNDKQLRRLNTLIGIIERLGPTHYSVIAAEANRLLPAAYQMTEHDVHSWLGRYTDVFTWVGKGKYALVSHDLGIRDGAASTEDTDPRTTSQAEKFGRSLSPEDAARGARIRRGIGDELFTFLSEHGPQPIDAIREHIHGRFIINDSSIDAAILMDRAKRFMWLDDDTVRLRAVGETAPPRVPRRIKLSKDEVLRLVPRGLDLISQLEDEAQRGFI